MPTRLGDITIVDSDAHIMENDEEILPYFEEEWVKRLIRDTPKPDNTIRSALYPTPITSQAYRSGEEDSSMEKADGSINADPATKLREMDDFSVDYAIVTPTMLLNLNTINNPRIGRAYTDAYNRFLENEFLGHHDNLKAAVLVSKYDPVTEAETINKLANEDDIVAVCMTNGAMDPPFGARYYDPIYEAAEQNGLPILIHNASGNFGMDFPVQYRQAHTYAEARTICQPFSHMWNLVTSFTRGLPERFPDLKMVWQEAGICWALYTIWRLNDSYMEYPDDIPDLTKLPEDYVEDRYYFTTQPLGHTTAENIASAIEMLGPDSVLFSSDLPHGAFDSPLEVHDILDSYFDRDRVRKIMGETAIDLFGL